MGTQGHENLKPFQPNFLPKRLEESLEALIIIVLEQESFLLYVKALRLLCGRDMYGAFEISAHFFLSSLSFVECKHKVLVAIVLFMSIWHVMAVVAILQQLALHQYCGAMTIMFVVTPKLDSIEHELNSKPIKFPKFYNIITLEAININKPQSERKERVKNVGIKPPKRRIELGWVTGGTRPKKPSSSCGFAHEAHRARGSQGLKTENCLILLHNLQSSFTSQNLTQ